ADDRLLARSRAPGGGDAGACGEVALHHLEIVHRQRPGDDRCGHLRRRTLRYRVSSVATDDSAAARCATPGGVLPWAAMDARLTTVVSWMVEARRILVFTGAGISTESG